MGRLGTQRLALLLLLLLLLRRRLLGVLVFPLLLALRIRLGGGLAGLLLSLAELLQLLLAEHNWLAVGAELDIATLEFALELGDADTGSRGVTLVVSLGELGRSGLDNDLGGGDLDRGSSGTLGVLLGLLHPPLLALLATGLLGLTLSLVGRLLAVPRGVLHVVIRVLGLAVGILHLDLLDQSFLGLLGLLVGLAVDLGTVDTISVGVVLPDLVQGELSRGSERAIGGNVGTLGQRRLALKLAEEVLELDAAGEAEHAPLLLIGIFAIKVGQGVDTKAKSRLGSERTGDLALVLAGSLTNERRMVDDTVLGRVVLGLEGAEQSLLGTVDLDGGTRRLGKAENGTSVGDQAGTDEGADEGRQVGGKSAHASLEVRGQLSTVLRVRDDLAGEELDVLEIVGRDFGTHANLSSGLDRGLELLREDVGKVGVSEVLAHADKVDETGVGKVVVEDLGQLREVPAVPLLGSHGVNVELLVEIIEKLDGLDDHGIDLVGGELELVARDGVGKTQSHAVDSLIGETGNQGRKVLANGTEKVQGGSVGNRLDVEVGELANGSTELDIGDGQRSLLLVLDLVEKVGQHRGNAALAESTGFLNGNGGAVELDKRLELEPEFSQ
ncbi:hypothetical protein BN1708_003876 [Verticillium longisporum]|uniref:Uncharacterized protein n=1 Tax=Verticillium longisporum TaxID=100787 RepID=A0A0G4LRW0_VERLO|nr:hypothetical protein BN1708_003876 [Verticillium longisporum]